MIDPGEQLAIARAFDNVDTCRTKLLVPGELVRILFDRGALVAE
jgi:hypothetical protein